MSMLLDEKYLYKSFAVQEERQVQWEVEYLESNQAKRIVAIQKTGKSGIEGTFGYIDMEIIKEARKQKNDFTEDQRRWLDEQKLRDKDKELLINLAARRTWGLND